MMRKSRNYILLIIAIPLAMITISSLYFLARTGNDVMNRLPDIIRTVANERINGKVEIGDIEVFPYKGVVASVITVTGTGSEDDRPVIRIPRIAVKLNMVDLVLKRKDPVSSIRSIDIEDPYIIIGREKDGSLNISRLIKPVTGGGQMQYRGRIQIRNASVTVSDKSLRSGRTEINRLASVNAVIDLSDPERARFDVWGKGQADRLNDIVVKGVYNLTRKSLTTDIDLNIPNARYWSEYPFHTGMNVLSGNLDARVRLVRESSESPIDYTVAVALNDTVLKLPSISSPARNISGDVQVRKNLVSVDLKGSIESSPVAVTGYVVDFAKPQLALNIKSNRINYREVFRSTPYAKTARGLRLPSSGRLDASVVGTIASPGVKFDMWLPAVSYGSVTGNAVSLNGIYAEKQIRINRGEINGYGGSARLSGDIIFSGKPQVNLNGRVNSVKLHNLPFMNGREVSGISDGDFVVHWKQRDLKARYKGTVRDTRYRDFVLDNSTIDGVYDNGKYRIDNLSIGMFGGKIAVSGDLDPSGSVNLGIAGSDINVAALRDKYWKSPAVGRAQFAGNVTGSLNSPVFDGFVEAYKVVVSGVEIERISGDISADMKSVTLNDLVVYDYPGTVSISGKITGLSDKHPGVDLKVKGDSLDVDRISQYFNSVDTSGGVLSADLAVSGPVNDPHAKGDIHVAGLSARDFSFDSIDTSLTYSKQLLNIDNLSVTSGDATVTAKGSIASDKTLNIDINGTRLPLNRLSEYLEPYADVKGTIDVAGTVSGVLKSPLADIEFNSDNAMINGRKFTSVHGNANLDNSIITVTDAQISESDSAYSINHLSYNPDSRTIDLDAKLDDIRGSGLLALLESSSYVRKPGDNNPRMQSILSRIPRPFEARLNASLSGSVVMRNKGVAPDLKIDADVTDLAYGTSTVNNLSLKGIWQNDLIRLDELEAVDGDTNISADASLGPADALSMRVDVHNLSTAPLKQWVKLPDNFSGKADVTIVADGSIYKPSTQMYLEIVDPVISGVKFDRLRSRLSSEGAEAGTISSDGSKSVGQIDIDELTLVLGDHDFRASGYIPVDWHGLVIRRDSPILVESNLDGDSLKLLSAVSGLPIETSTDGRFDGSIKLAGTVMDPKLSGILAWRDGRIMLPKINSPVIIDQADILLSGNKLSLDKFVGRSDKGGTFSVDGGITLVDMKPDMNLNISADNLRLAGRNFSNIYGEDVDAELQGKLAVTGNINAPRITGDMNIPSGVLSVSGKPVQAAIPVASSIDPIFAVNVSLGNDVRFRSSRLKVPLRGQISINGALSKLNVDGGIDISDGTIAFPMRAVKLQPGSRMEIHMRPNQQTAMLLDLQGETKLISVSPLGEQRKYDVTMTARGTLDNLNTVFESSPPGLSEESIVALLTGQRQLEQIFSQNRTGDIGRELSGLFSSAMLPSVIAPIEKAFQDVLGFEEFSLQMGYQEPLQVTIGEKLWDGVTLSYTAFLGSRPDYEDSLYELRLLRRFKSGLEAGLVTDQSKTISLVAEGKIRF